MQARLIAWAVVFALALLVARCDMKFGKSALPGLGSPAPSPVLDMLPPDPDGCAKRGC